MISESSAITSNYLYLQFEILNYCKTKYNHNFNTVINENSNILSQYNCRQLTQICTI